MLNLIHVPKMGHKYVQGYDFIVDAAKVNKICDQTFDTSSTVSMKIRK